MAPMYRDVPAVDALDQLAKDHDLALASATSLDQRLTADMKFSGQAELLGLMTFVDLYEERLPSLSNAKATLAGLAVPFRELFYGDNTLPSQTY